MAFENPVVGGEFGELIRAAIQSPDYVVNVSGWTINRDGSAEFNDITIRGGAIVGGSITIGPAGMPQVVIDSTPFAGFISFPTNASFEDMVAMIRAQANEADPTVGLSLLLQSATTDTSSDQATIVLSSESQDTLTPASIAMAVPGANLDLTDTGIRLRGALTTSNSEIFVDDDSTNGNYPSRLSRGRVTAGTTPTTINLGLTSITDATCTGVVLEADIVYEVSVIITLRSSAGASAAGTQHLEWSLFTTSIAGTLLGNPVRNFKPGVGSAQSELEIKFLFVPASSFSGTLQLGARKITGGDTVEAIVGSRYSMLVRREGRRSNVTNL